MTYEEMQRMMQFILEQQAQLVANGQRTDERNARADKRLDRAEKLITRTARTVDGLATYSVERFEGTDARISAESEDVNAKLAALVDSQMRTEEVMKKSDEDFKAKLNALVESQMRTEKVVRRLSERGEKTDEAVRNLTDVVGRHLREHGNGERDVSRE
jgi:hypothetical protein